MPSPLFLLSCFFVFLATGSLTKFKRESVLAISMAFTFWFSPYVAASLILLFLSLRIWRWTLSESVFAGLTAATLFLPHAFLRGRLNGYELAGWSFAVFRLYSLGQHLRHRAKTEVIDDLIYIYFGPTFVAGPIVDRMNFRFEHTDRQGLSDPRAYWWFASGMVKLFGFAPIVMAQKSALFGSPPLEACFQYLVVFLNFSGYTDLMRSFARLIGIMLPPNFDNPFRAFTIVEFWNRQHMSLTAWLKGNLFLPLVFSFGRRKRILILIPGLVMFLSSFWHGISLGVLIFFLLQIVGLELVDRLPNFWSSRLIPLRRAVQWFLTQWLAAISIVYLLWDGREETPNWAAALFGGVMTATLIIFCSAVLLDAVTRGARFVEGSQARWAKAQWFFLGCGFSLVTLWIWLMPSESVEFIYSRF